MSNEENNSDNFYRNMKTLIIMPGYFSNGVTGDAMQGRSTLAALREQGVEARPWFGSCAEDGHVLSDAEKHDDLEWCDVIHFFLLPMPQKYKSLRSYVERKPVLVSTIFWKNFDRMVIAWRNRVSLIDFAKYFVRYIQSWLFPRDCRWCDVILPNSWSEGRNFMEWHRMAEDAASFPIPNAIVPPLSREEIAALPRHPEIPFSEYLVCPGVFATRKNQQGLIKALRNTPYPVVFVGGKSNGQERYYDRCRRLANDRMLFVGYKPSSEPEYWQILGHAKAAVLASDCETPAIAMQEAAWVGLRPVITANGGTAEYYGMAGEYLDPCRERSIKQAVEQAWARGRLSEHERDAIHAYSWRETAELTLAAYRYAAAKRKEKTSK